MHGHRIYLNLSQDGFADVDNLRNRGLVHALKITSETYVHSTAFRVSATGFEHLRSQLGSADKASDVSVYASFLTGDSFACFHLIHSTFSKTVHADSRSGLNTPLFSTIAGCLPALC